MTDDNSPFRWIEREVTTDFGRFGVAPTTKIVKVLQYKAYKVVKRPHCGVGEYGVDFDWKDVPTVKEREV
jgi:hypothetical protein